MLHTLSTTNTFVVLGATMLRAAVLSLCLCWGFAAHAAADWIVLESKDHRIQFQPPYNGVAQKDVFLQEKRGGGEYAEWVCWRYFRDKASNSCITFQTSVRGFNSRVLNPKDVIFYYDDFDEVSLEQEDEIHELGHPISSALYLRFEVTNSSGRKSCVAFTLRPRPKKKDIDGWYCAPTGHELSVEVIELLISSVGIKDEYEPGPIDYPPLEK